MPAIVVHEEKCSGCQTCQLWCSYTFTNAFNPLMAYIRQEFVPGQGFKITFTEDCNQCAICADHCVYGALTLE